MRVKVELVKCGLDKPVRTILFGEVKNHRQAEKMDIRREWNDWRNVTPWRRCWGIDEK